MSRSKQPPSQPLDNPGIPHSVLALLAMVLVLGLIAVLPNADLNCRIFSGGACLGLLFLAIGAFYNARHPNAGRVGQVGFCLSLGPAVAPFTSLTSGALVSVMLPALASLLWLQESAPTAVTSADGAPDIEQMTEERDAEIKKLFSTLEELEKAGIQLAGASTSLAATARQQEASIAEQAAAATEIMATSRQINATSQELANTMEEVAHKADDAAQLANGGQELLTRMQSTLDQVVSASTGIASKLATLNERANKIGSVVITISKVADQTNLLSLNAAIEAEKAGELGRGFGVVATEIRRLADQTAVATLDIDHIIHEMLSAVSAGVMGMEKFTEDVRESAGTGHALIDHLGQIITQVQSMNERFEQVNHGMRSQAQGAEQISDSIRQLSDATHQTANSVKELNVSIDALQQAIQQLAGTVVRGRAGKNS